VLAAGTLLCLWAADAASGARPYVNDKSAPENLRDLKTIQKALTRNLERTRKATVGIDLGEGAGSGVVVSKDGLVLTAAHVAGGVGKEITVILEGGKKVKATTLGLNSETDCAMVQIHGGGPYPFVEVDRAGSVKLGDWVYSLGHSGGYDKKRGAVVRLGRLVKISDSTIQSDCTLIGGDSGGPLFDLEGRLIGIHSRVGGWKQNNMHVPMREFMRNWDAMLAGKFIGDGAFAKKPKKGSGFLGVGSEDAPGGGVRVKKVGRESPAEKAGIEAGDVLVELNGKPIKDKAGFKKALAEMAAGDKVKLKLRRGGKELEIETKLDER
jgi:serine protease Do